MSLANTDLLLYCSANMPEDDTSTSGGAIATTVRPEFTQLTTNAIIEVVSDGADTRNVTITGRLASGVITSETLTLNGTTAVDGATTFERVLKVIASATSSTRTITVKQGVGGSTIATIPVNETGFRITFYRSASETGAVDRYEKLFWDNVHGTLALIDALHRLSADPSSKITVGLATAKGGSTSVANRKTVPAGITFVDDNVDQSVPGTFLGAGENIGVWVKQSLAGSDAAAKSTFTLQISGTSI